MTDQELMRGASNFRRFARGVMESGIVDVVTFTRAAFSFNHRGRKLRIRHIDDCLELLEAKDDSGAFAPVREPLPVDLDGKVVVGGCISSIVENPARVLAWLLGE